MANSSKKTTHIKGEKTNSSQKNANFSKKKKYQLRLQKNLKKRRLDIQKPITEIQQMKTIWSLPTSHSNVGWEIILHGSTWCKEPSLWREFWFLSLLRTNNRICKAYFPNLENLSSLLFLSIPFFSGPSIQHIAFLPLRINCLPTFRNAPLHPN